ncbi:histone-lysine N-methyltransferase SETD1A-like isoform X1 [Echeneis naucrates]|uniref:histone-lysine N-methyltransferase SETD1A-like isoform X1 n=1 Tax=Echeneis naucrates TaxID=173247 RepID=UPI0011144201|nr:histone-lysine N-methyltransferase SETD1A-like isoform X1 [Echeneis naucrates]
MQRATACVLTKDRLTSCDQLTARSEDLFLQAACLTFDDFPEVCAQDLDEIERAFRESSPAPATATAVTGPVLETVPETIPETVPEAGGSRKATAEEPRPYGDKRLFQDLEVSRREEARGKSGKRSKESSSSSSSSSSYSSAASRRKYYRKERRRRNSRSRRSRSPYKRPRSYEKREKVFILREKEVLVL